MSITPLALNNIRGLYAETHTDGSNAFIYSRFLVPWLSGWTGTSIYVDSDVLFRCDIAELWNLRSLTTGVQVVAHPDYVTKMPIKYLGNKNESFPRKNWSSVIMFNNGFMPNRILTSKFVANATGEYLHWFSWLHDDQIGRLPKEFNHLVTEQEPNKDAKIYHWTLGLPCFNGFEDQEGADEWRDTLGNMLTPIRLNPDCGEK